MPFARNRRRTPTPARSHVALPCAYEKRRCAPTLPLPCSCTNAGAPAPAHPRPHAKRRRSRSRVLAQNEGGTGFVPRPAFLRPDISTGCLCGRARCRLVFGCRPRLLVAAGIRLLAALPALRPIGDGPSSWSASAVPSARSLALLTDADLQLAACALLAGAGLQLAGLRSRDLGGRATGRKLPTCD